MWYVECVHVPGSRIRPLPNAHAGQTLPVRMASCLRRSFTPTPLLFLVGLQVLFRKQAVLLAPGAWSFPAFPLLGASSGQFGQTLHGQWRDRVGFAPNFSIKLSSSTCFPPVFHCDAILTCGNCAVQPSGALAEPVPASRLRQKNSAVRHFRSRKSSFCSNALHRK